VASQKRPRGFGREREGRTTRRERAREGARRDDDANKQQRGDGEHASQACCPDARPAGRPTHSCAYAQRTRTAVLRVIQRSNEPLPANRQATNYLCHRRPASLRPPSYCHRRIAVAHLACTNYTLHSQPQRANEHTNRHHPQIISLLIYSSFHAIIKNVLGILVIFGLNSFFFLGLNADCMISCLLHVIQLNPHKCS
jgi:hypothetical protein